MASFDKSEEKDVPAPFKRFLIPVATSHGPIKGNAQHIHTTPEWENAPQYLVLIPVKCPKSRLGDRWTSRKADSSKRKFGFYIDNHAVETLRDLWLEKQKYWQEIGKHEHTRAEYLEQLDKLKEGQAQLTRAKSQYTRSQATRFKSNLPSLAETAEEKDGWSIATTKRGRPEPPATRSVKSRRQ
ncbi:hypothetical protein MPER_05709 [Moniliophthora perniciosa FA553]|nr:hypothetical protein MPER_05709 [Moniliophthora perniciosa FA553]